MLKLEEQINQLSKAVNRLSESLALPKTDIVRDSAIQRFEFCLDLSWKTLKTYLEENKGIIVKSPKETFRIAYQQGLVEYDTKWLSLVDLRNETVHTYNEAFAEEVYNQLSPALEVLKVLSNKLSQK